MEPTQEPQLEKGSLSYETFFNNEIGRYILNFMEHNQTVFRIEFCIPDYEMLAASMVRTIKNHNLETAQAYLKDKKEGKLNGTGETTLEDGNSESQRLERPSDQSANNDQIHGGETS